MKPLATLCALMLLTGTLSFAQEASPWDAIAERAKAAKPGVYSAERAALQERDNYKRYYEAFKNWTPPADNAANGKLKGLRDKPTAPRFALTGKVWPQTASALMITMRWM